MRNTYKRYQDTGEDDAKTLETDVMRFVAIIGIVFWIIFAFVAKDQPPPPPPLPATTSTAATTTTTSTTTTTTTMGYPTTALSTTTMSSSTTTSPTSTTTSSTILAPLPGSDCTLTINFRGVEAILGLVNAGRIAVYYEASGTAFNFIFKAYVDHHELSFKVADSVPEELWRMTDQNILDYASARIAQKDPVTKALAKKELFVSFIDKSLEKRAETVKMKLQAENRCGKIRIDKNGEIQFEEYEVRQR